jgi:protocatechuate 4,5-dioxygenase, alpha chain
MSRSIHDILAELEDIPGTRVFTAARARQGYWLNQFCMTLMSAENRARFRSDEAGYLADWPLSAAQRAAVLARDYNAAIDAGGNIYFLAKLFFTDGISFLQAVGTMTGMNAADYQAMMIAGGRSPIGLRSIREQG